MAETPDRSDTSEDAPTDEPLQIASSTHKVVGELDDTSGAGVLGKNTASSGTPIGVEGAVPNAADGFGLSTPDDVRVEGEIDTDETDFVVNAGTKDTIDGQNVVLGHSGNRVSSGVKGATISGGGLQGPLADGFHTVTEDYGTIGGGFGNTAGRRATVGGGESNRATGSLSTIPGGFANEAFSKRSTITGGRGNRTGESGTDKGSYATVAGGENNVAAGDHSFAAGREATASNDGAFVVGDSTDAAVTSQNPDEARFQGQVVSESYVETGNSYYFDESAMLLDTFEDGSTGNDVLAVSVPGTYGIPFTQMRVNEFGDVVITGDLDVQGSNKNFVQPVETDDGEKEVVYTASEAGEARTEASGVATVEDGQAVIELPDHFDWVTSDDEPLVVQTTPYADESVQPQVTERSTERIVIEDFAGVDEYEVAYTVKGTRDGQEDKQIVREPTPIGPSPAPADDD